MIYLDNAATSWPKPDPVYQTLADFLKTAGANPGRSGHKMAALASATIDDTRAKLARLFGVSDPRRVIFASNTTDALNLAIKGTLRPGDHVVTTVMEHNSIRRPLRALAAHDVSTTKVPADRQGFIDPADIASAIRPNTRLIAMTHASNVNGALQPVEEVAEIAHRHGCLLLVDAAQTAGTIPISLGRLGADLLAFPGHKALMGPPGTGGLLIGDRVGFDDLIPVREGGTGGNSEEDVQPQELPARFEAGTVNTVGIAALGTALDYLAETGVEAAGAHEREMNSRLIEGLAAIPGVTVLSPADESMRVACTSIVVDGWEPADFGIALDSAFDIACRTGLHCAPEACGAIGALPYGTVRLSAGFYTSIDDIDRAVAAVGELAGAALRMD
ncbi:MAG TPA: aminotransferase class V-fold PLP-dependent enzyme [Thermomicrobiaceae bacterium]|nr:aminotransferase class V-fold PLP-dependent enzyme [Thermomicrobiaceae bacterium]